MPAFSAPELNWEAILYILPVAIAPAIAQSFIGKVGAVLSTMPVPVMDGIMVLLFGTIAAVGMSTLVNSKDDLTAPRNLAIALVCGLSGVVFSYGEFSLQGIGLTAVVLNLVLPRVTIEDSAKA